MKNFLTTLLFVLPLIVIAQTTPSQDQNYVLQKTYQIPLSETEVGLLPNNVSSNDKKIESIVYYDGLGRPKQSISLRAGGNGEDLMTPVFYDDLGRQPKEYLPYPNLGNEGVYVQSILTPLLGYYDNRYDQSFHNYDINPYSENRFDDSPLSRVLETGAPGKDWKIDPISDTDHTIKFEYLSNTVNEVKRFSVSFTNGNTRFPELVDNGFYTEKHLFKTITKDENWTNGNNNTTQEFKDKLGQVVLKRTFNSNSAHDTYYVYDSYGNLTYVIPPIVNTSNIITPTILDTYCYQYKYDYRNRLFEKKIPGKGYERILYDKLDRPILTQDANMRADNPNKFLFTKYDCLGRVAYTGIYLSPFAGQPELETFLSTKTAFCETQTSSSTLVGDTNIYYTSNVFPLSQYIEKIFTVNYYDTYVDYAGAVAKPTTVFNAYTTEHVSVETTTQGLPTVSKVRVLGTNDWITTLSAYDEKGRVLYVDSKNSFLDSRDIVKNKLDFTGKVTESESTHIKTGHPNIIMHDYFSYDHIGRNVLHTQKIDEQPMQLISQNHYDDLGQLVKKKVGGELWKSGYTDMIGVSMVNGVITSTAPTGWNNSSVSTIGKIDDYGGVMFTAETEGKALIIGLNDLNVNQNFSEIDYGIYLTESPSDPKYYLRYNNDFHQYTPYQLGDTFAVERSGNNILFIHNGIVVYTHVITSGIVPSLVADSSFYTNGGAISNFSLYATTITKHLQDVDFKYNVRGWLTDINEENPLVQTNDLFSFKLNYNTIDGNTGATPLYNGNISQSFWKTDNTDTYFRGYKYSYDDLNRIESAISYKGTNLNSLQSDVHNVSNLSYDKNGNILTLDRNGSNDDNTFNGLWDKLTYSYSGNQLLNVLEDSNHPTLKDVGFFDGNNVLATLNNDYEYDDNGNMVKDRNKLIDEIEYNNLNLPTLITITGTNSGTIEYIYDATGVKLKKIMTKGIESPKITEYAGSFVYNNTELQFISQPEGYVIPLIGEEIVEGFDEGSGQNTYAFYNYVFQYKDHLGNIRLSYADADLNGAIDSSEIIEENNYYPFGLQQKGYNAIIQGGNSIAQKRKYNGMELNNDLGIDLTEMIFRNYDQSIGRFSSIDLMAEEAVDYTPYRFGFNNPIYFSDPTGLYEKTAGGGYKTNDPDEIQRLLAYINRDGTDVSFSGINKFIEGDIEFTESYNKGLPLTAVYATYNASTEVLSVSDFGLHKIQNEVAYYQGKTDYLYDRSDYEMRNQILSGGTNDPISRRLLDSEKEGAYQPITAANYIRYIGDEKTARMIVYGDFLQSIDGPAMQLGSIARVKPRFLGKNTSGRFSSPRARKLGFDDSAGIPRNVREMSFNDFHIAFSGKYKGKFKGRGTYMQHMARDWHAIKSGF